MHAARVAARSSVWRPLVVILSGSSSTRLFASRTLSTSGAPAAKAKPGKEAKGEAPLATRLKQKRSRNEPTGETEVGHQTISTASRPGSGPVEAGSPSNAAAPHKLRVPNAAPTGSANDPIAAALRGPGPDGNGKQRKRSASVEGFRAKRHAMQRMRREMTQAVQEAHGDAWSAGEVSVALCEEWLFGFFLVRITRRSRAWTLTPFERLPAVTRIAQEPLRARYGTIHPPPEPPTRQGPTPTLSRPAQPDRIAPKAVALARQARAPVRIGRVCETGPREREAEARDQKVGGRITRAQRDRVCDGATRFQGTGTSCLAFRGRGAPAGRTADAFSLQEGQDFEAMIDEHVGALGQASPEVSAASITGPTRSTGDGADRSIAVDRQRTWPEEMEQMVCKIPCMFVNVPLIQVHSRPLPSLS